MITTLLSSSAPRLLLPTVVSPKSQRLPNVKENAKGPPPTEYNDNNAVEFKKRGPAVPANSGKTKITYLPLTPRRKLIDGL